MHDAQACFLGKIRRKKPTKFQTVVGLILYPACLALISPIITKT